MNKKIHIGDTVSVLDENLKGKVIAVSENSIHILDTDGFERSYIADELVVYKKNQFMEETIETPKQVSIINTHNQLIQLNDQVAILDEKIRGKVTKINGYQVTIEDTNGFESIFHADEIIIYDTVLSADKTNTHIKQSDNKISGKQKIIKSSIVDLHNTNNYLDKNRILENQISIFKEELNHAIQNGQIQITIIHGKGQGILKKELQTILQKEGILYKKAPHRSFGQGAIVISLIGINRVI